MRVMFSIVETAIGCAHKTAVGFMEQFGRYGLTEDREEVKELYEPLVIHVYRPDYQPMIASTSRYSKQFMEDYSKQVMGCTDNSFTYTYGNRLRNYNGIDQLQNAIDVLNKAQTSRRAILHTWMVEKDLGGEHVPCLQTVQFIKRDGNVNCIATFRSNDILGAWGANAYALTKLLEVVVDGTFSEMGYLETYSQNAHIYIARDADYLEKFLNNNGASQ